MADAVNLLIYPEIEEGFEESDVRENLIKTLKVDKAKVEEWFLAEEATILLHSVDVEVAQKYEAAIMKCGARCEVREAGKDGLTLMPKLRNKNTKLWICPSCEYEMDIDREEEVDQCPECGLVMAKWEERMKEEAEKEKIRRRLLREQRLKDEGQSERDAQLAELERLKALEREIMKELGIKPPSKLWQLFEQYTFGMAASFTVVIIVATAVAFKYVDQEMDAAEEQALVDAAPSEEIQAIAPVIGTAMEMQMTGNEQVMNEVAGVAGAMQGGGNAARQEIVSAAQQMMKGVEADKFIAAASQMPGMPSMSKALPGEQPQPVNLDTIGGVSGLSGAPSFTPEALTTMAPPAVVDGQSTVLDTLHATRIVPDPIDPSAPGVVLEAIDELDGSAIVELMGELKKDLEWDLFLAWHGRQYIEAGEFDKASELASSIANPVTRIEVLTDVMTELQLDGRDTDVKLQMGRVRLDLDNIPEADTRARLMLGIGEALAGAGSRIEPQGSFSRIEDMARSSANQSDRAMVQGWLAVGFVRDGNNGRARQAFAAATNAASQIQEPAARIRAFANLARRYYDARNMTLASEILAEADVQAATRLEPDARSFAFADIAMARGYIGDLPGARMAIDNAAQGSGRDQLLARLALQTIEQGKPYVAMEIMRSLPAGRDLSRLENRVLAYFLHEGRPQEAGDRFQQALTTARTIIEPADRGVQVARLGRIAGRLGDEDRADELFAEARDYAAMLEGRKEQLNLAIVALEMARVFWFADANDLIGQLDDIVIRDPVGNEILATEQVVKTQLPPDLIPFEEG